MLCAMSIIAWLALGLVHLLEPHHPFFFEQDISFSYPFIEDRNVTVPSALLFVYAIVIPIILMIAAYRLPIWVVGKNLQRFPLVPTFLWFLVTTGMALFITEVLKHYIGRPRPNFFAMCNYQGYRAVSTGGNRSSFLAATSPLTQANLSKCWALDMVPKGLVSCPSGHSSLSMAGLGFTALFFHQMFSETANSRMLPHWKWSARTIARTAVPFACILGALFVGSSRIFDYWHHVADVLMGFSIGAAAAAMPAVSYFGTEDWSTTGTEQSLGFGHARLTSGLPPLQTSTSTTHASSNLRHGLEATSVTFSNLAALPHGTPSTTTVV